MCAIAGRPRKKSVVVHVQYVHMCMHSREAMGRGYRACVILGKLGKGVWSACRYREAM